MPKKKKIGLHICEKCQECSRDCKIISVGEIKYCPKFDKEK